MAQFGNWLVTPDGIEWKGGAKYVIEKEVLAATSKIGEAIVYDWPMHIVSKSWLTIEDLYTFNTAFMFALENLKVESRPMVSLADTFLAQQTEFQINHEDDEDDDDEFTIGIAR